jgi:hypothetical protein
MDTSDNQSHSAQGDTGSVEEVLAGLLTREQLAEQLDCSERTIIRYERAGMPFIAFGMIRRYNPPSVREWMLSKERGHTVPKRGRPAGRKAA